MVNINFTKQWANSLKVITKAVDDTIKEASIELFEKIVHDTPVDTGLLRGNWQTTLKDPATQKLDRLDPGGSQAIAEINSVIKGLKGAGSIFFSNNADHFDAIEYGSHSKQAPFGMVRVNVSKFDSIVDRIAKRHKV